MRRGLRRRWLLALLCSGGLVLVPALASAQESPDGDPWTKTVDPGNEAITFVLLGSKPRVVLGQYLADASGNPDVQLPKWEYHVDCSQITAPDPCTETDLVPREEPIHITFSYGQTWRYPVHVQSTDCDVHQSVAHALLTEPSDVSLSCDVTVPYATELRVFALWRSGAGSYCFHSPGAAPPPAASNTWEYAVADFPNVPAPVPVDAIAQAQDCAHMPPSDALAAVDG